MIKEKHISEQSLIDLVFEINNNEIADRLHLDKCAFCKKRFEYYSEVLKESDNKNISPSEFLEARIRKSVSEPEINFIKSELFFSKPAISIAAGFVMIITASILWLAWPERKVSSVKEISASVEYLKNVPGADGSNRFISSAVAGNTIEAGHSSPVIISIDKTFSIVLSSGSKLKIIQLRKPDNDKPLLAQFYLEKGEILARFGHDGLKVDYSFETQNAVIKSIGTEFLLKSDNNITGLSMAEGKVNLMLKPDGKTIETTGGMTYTAGREFSSEINSTDTINRIALLSKFREKDNEIEKPGTFKERKKEMKTPNTDYKEKALAEDENSGTKADDNNRRNDRAKELREEAKRLKDEQEELRRKSIRK